MATMNPIVQSMLPSQKHTVKSFPAPQEFAPNDWQFDVNRAQKLNWRPENAVQSSDNYFTLNEPHQDIKNSMFMQLTGEEPIYGHTNYFLNPLQQEQTNAHSSAYSNQKISRVSDNMNPFSSIMSAPPERYPVNVWLNSYKGSMNRPRYN
jgi:hypothetical protein